MSAFFLFSPFLFSLNRMFNNCINYIDITLVLLEIRRGNQNDSLRKKLLTKSPALLGLSFNSAKSVNIFWTLLKKLSRPKKNQE